MEPFDLKFDFHLFFVQTTTDIGYNKSSDLFQPITVTVAACKNK